MLYKERLLVLLWSASSAEEKAHVGFPVAKEEQPGRVGCVWKGAVTVRGAESIVRGWHWCGPRLRSLPVSCSGFWPVDKECVLSGKIWSQIPHKKWSPDWASFTRCVISVSFSVRWQQLAQIRALQPTDGTAWVLTPILSYLLPFCGTQQPHEGHQQGLWRLPPALYGEQFHAWELLLGFAAEWPAFAYWDRKIIWVMCYWNEKVFLPLYRLSFRLTKLRSAWVFRLSSAM